MDCLDQIYSGVLSEYQKLLICEIDNFIKLKDETKDMVDVVQFFVDGYEFFSDTDNNIYICEGGDNMGKLVGYLKNGTIYMTEKK